MVIELICFPLFVLVEFFISLLPNAMALPGWLGDTMDLLSKALLFFPSDVWAIAIGNIVFWQVALVAWALIEWVYKKVPGVD